MSDTVWLEWSLHRMEHLLYIWDNPKSVKAGFGPGETMDALRDELPKLRKRLKQASEDSPTPVV